MPLRNSLHVDQLLSNIAVKYQNTLFIHDRVMPAIPVKKTSDLYRTYTQNWRIPSTARAVGAVAREHDFQLGTASYLLEKHALRAVVADTAADNYDITDLRADVTIELTEKILMRKEASCASLFTTTSWSLGTSYAAGDTWVTSTAYPVAQFDTACAVVVGNSGVRPNYAVIPLDSYNALKNNANVIDRIKYTSREINEAIIGALIGLGELLVPNMYYDQSNLGATSSLTPIWKNDFAFVGYKPAAPGFLALSSGYQLMKNKPMVRRWREEEREGDFIEVDVEYQFKVVASLTGYYMNNTI